jgi:hypothetical protein
MEAFLAGLLAKVYDDLTDNHMINPLGQEILKGLQWMLLTLLSYNDFNFAFINYVMNLIHGYFNDEAFSKPYEKSLLILYPILLVISFPTIQAVNIYTWFYIICFIGVMGIEPILIPEEYSYKKLISRIVVSINLFIGIVLSYYFDISPSLIKLVYYSLGYGLFSSGFQAFLLMSSTQLSSTSSSFFSWI